MQDVWKNFIRSRAVFIPVIRQAKRETASIIFYLSYDGSFSTSFYVYA